MPDIRHTTYEATLIRLPPAYTFKIPEVEPDSDAVSIIRLSPSNPSVPSHLITILPDEALPAFIKEQAQLLRDHFSETLYTLAETINMVTALAKDNGLFLPADGDITKAFIRELFHFDELNVEDPFAVVFALAENDKARAFAQEALALWNGPATSPVPLEPPSEPTNETPPPICTVEQTPVASPKPRFFSYVDIAFQLNPQDGTENYTKLPDIVQRDVLTNVSCLPGCEGAAETAARALYHIDTKRSMGELTAALDNLKTKSLSGPTSISPSLKRKGEEILELFHASTQTWLTDSLSKFEQFPKDARFYQYVYEQAKHAGIQIADWDQKWAEFHWKDPEVIPHSIQALKRYLHTS